MVPPTPAGKMPISQDFDKHTRQILGQLEHKLAVEKDKLDGKFPEELPDAYNNLVDMFDYGILDTSVSAHALPNTDQQIKDNPGYGVLWGSIERLMREWDQKDYASKRTYIKDLRSLHAQQKPRVFPPQASPSPDLKDCIASILGKLLELHHVDYRTKEVIQDDIQDLMKKARAESDFEGQQEENATFRCVWEGMEEVMDNVDRSKEENEVKIEDVKELLDAA